MAEQSGRKSPFEENLRSFLEAVSMFEHEASVLLDRLGVDGETVRRGLDVLGVVSGDLVRQLAGTLGLADAKAVDVLSRDLRGLLERVARLREQQRDVRSRVDGRLDQMEKSGARFDEVMQAMARVQGRAEARLSGLEERSSSLESKLALRSEQLDLVEGLRLRIEKLETLVASVAGGVRANKAGARKTAPRRATARSGDSTGPIREERSEPAAAKPRTR